MRGEKVKNEIIDFVMMSPDEDNLQIAVFIAGMRAQKNINLKNTEGQCKKYHHNFRDNCLKL